jgi:hypothetical protein
MHLNAAHFYTKVKCLLLIAEGMFDHKREKINFEEIKMKGKYRRAQMYVSLLTTIVPCHYADRADRDVQSSAT